MTREFESMTKRFDEGHLKSKEKAAECRMANMLVEDKLSHGAYELPESARRHIIAYSDIATPPWTTEPPGARHAGSWKSRARSVKPATVGNRHLVSRKPIANRLGTLTKKIENAPKQENVQALVIITTSNN